MDLPREGDLDITPSLLAHFQKDLSDMSIYLKGLSGSWGDDFCRLLNLHNDSMLGENIEILLLASETIYSPSSIAPFTEVLMRTLRGAESAGGKAVALVAAKRVYFGVGGGVDEFLRVLKNISGKANAVWESAGPGIGRVILEVTTDNKITT